MLLVFVYFFSERPSGCRMILLIHGSTLSKHASTSALQIHTSNFFQVMMLIVSCFLRSVVSTIRFRRAPVWIWFMLPRCTML